METLDPIAARRLALACAGLLPRRWSGLPDRASGGGRRACEAAQAVIERFGYLQLDTVSVAGARSHVLVLLSRLQGFDPALGEALLQPGRPLFEYWGHEASWIPHELYPAFGFRRRAWSQRSPWWSDLVDAHPAEVDALLERVAERGPLRAAELEEPPPGDRPRAGRRRGGGWWDHKLVKRLAVCLWFGGRLAIARRDRFQRSFDLPERVIPPELQGRDLPREDALDVLLERALSGHGWATRGTLAATWRLRNMVPELEASLARLTATGRVVPCALAEAGGKRTRGYVRTSDLELADRLRRARPRPDAGVLLSPFDPLLWDRPRVQRLFGFEALLEIFKPAAQRRFGYFCLPVLAGERLVARFDLAADRAAGRCRILNWTFEGPHPRRPASETDREACRVALARHADALGLRLVGGPRLG